MGPLALDRAAEEGLHPFVDLAARQTRSFRAGRSRPYTPKTNGKAERFIQTALVRTRTPDDS
jgi:transposase InsO family protein